MAKLAAQINITSKGIAVCWRRRGLRIRPQIIRTARIMAGNDAMVKLELSALFGFKTKGLWIQVG